MGVVLHHILETKLANLRNVAAKRKDPRPRRHDLIRRYVVADLEKDLRLQAVGQGLELRQRDDIRAPLKIHPLGILLSKGRLQHVAHHNRIARLIHARIVQTLAPEVPRIRNDACQSRGDGRLGADEADLVLDRTGSAGKIPGHGAQTDFIGRGRLAHADAAVAARLVHPRAGLNERHHMAVPRQRRQELPRRRVHVEGHMVGNLPSPQHLRRHCEIPVARIGARANVGLVNGCARCFPHGLHVARARRHGYQRLQSRKIDRVVPIVPRPFVSRQVSKIVFALLRGKKPPHGVVRRENGGRGAEFGAHVRDDVTIHRREAFQSRPVVFENAVHRAFHPVSAQHFQDDVFCAHPVGQAAP